MSDIKVINIKDSSFKMWESDASGGDANGSEAGDANGSDAGDANGIPAGGSASDRIDNDQDFDEKSENLFESSTMSGGSDDDFDAFDRTAGDKLDLFEDNMSRASSFSDQSGGSKKNKSDSDSEKSDIESKKSEKSDSELEDDESLLEELSRDPLMIVLGNFLISRKGNNIADILEDIRDHLGYIRHYLSE
jgi:hypothetical protein